MAKHWDSVMKILAKADPQAVVSLLAEGAVFENEMNTEMKTDTLIADLLYTVIWEQKKCVLHVEFQRKQDKNMGWRLLQYNVLSRKDNSIPVCSVVIYLVKGGTVITSPYTEVLPNGELQHAFYFRCIKLWEIEAETFKKAGLEGLLPLLPLTREGKQRQTVEDMITGLKAAGREDLLPIGYTIASLVYVEASDQQWLRERFIQMQDIIQDSWGYQEIMQEGFEKGIEKGIEKGKFEESRSTLERLVQKRFPALLALVKQDAGRISSLEALHAATDELFDAESAEDARQIIVSALQHSQKLD